MFDSNAKVKSQSWSVVSTIRAAKHHVERYIEHYRKSGASRIYLFFDDPSMAWGIRGDDLKVVVCDESYWGTYRPESIEERQRLNSRRALRWCSTEWILHCDVDEFASSKLPISELLALVPSNVESVLIPVYEAVYMHEPSQADAYDTPFFKRPVKVERGFAPIVWTCFGSLTRLSTGGMWGHIRGKSFARKSICADSLPIHRYKEAHCPGNKVNFEIEEFKLLHFDSLTFVDWKEKNLRRLDGAVMAKEMGGKRLMQIEAIRDARSRWGEWGLHDLYRRMNVLNRDMILSAINAGFVNEIDR